MRENSWEYKERKWNQHISLTSLKIERGFPDRFLSCQEMGLLGQASYWRRKLFFDIIKIWRSQCCILHRTVGQIPSGHPMSCTPCVINLICSDLRQAVGRVRWAPWQPAGRNIPNCVRHWLSCTILSVAQVIPNSAKSTKLILCEKGTKKKVHFRKK